MDGHNTQLKTDIPKGCRRIFDVTKIITKDYEKIWFWVVANTLIA